MKLHGKQAGFSLLEVLIATIVLAIGLLGVASLQLSSNAHTEAGLQRSHAAGLAREIFERMRINYVEAKAGNYDIGTLPVLTTDCEGAAVECTPEQIKEHDLRVWSERVTALLPGSDASISTGPDDGENSVDITITMQWDQSRGQNPVVSESFSFRLMGLNL